MSRHYTDENKYPKLNERYSTLHLKQYLDEDDILRMEKILETGEYDNKSEKEILDLWDKDLPLLEYCDRIRSTIARVMNIRILKEEGNKVYAKVDLKTKVPFYVSPDGKEELKFCECDVTIDKTRDDFLEGTLHNGGVHLTWVDYENIANAIKNKLDK